jgi:acyl-CoA synthetase (AMP-forming)/AMP-acid ligase II
VAPPILLALAKHPLVDQYDLSSLVSVLSGAAPLDEQLALAAEKRLRRGADTGVIVAQGYGMTELSPVSHTTPDPGAEPPGVTSPVPKGSVGYAIPDTECRLIDPETGADAAEGGSGELWIRGPQVMKGYLNNPQATANTIDADGWLHTGDLCAMDERGYCTVEGRLKDMIIRGGENIYPREIEEFLYGHPAVEEVQVIGVPDPKYGEELCAWIRLRPGTQLDADQVREYCKGKIAHYKVPRYIRFTSGFPMTITGKIQKFKMRQTSTTELGLQEASHIGTA